MPYHYIPTCKCGTAQSEHPTNECAEYQHGVNRVVWVNAPGQTSSPADYYGSGSGTRGRNTGD